MNKPSMTKLHDILPRSTQQHTATPPSSVTDQVWAALLTPADREFLLACGIEVSHE